MIQELAPVLFLLTAALFVFGSMNVAGRLGVSRTVGCGVALCIIAIAIGVSPASWRATWAGASGGDRLLTYARIVGMSGMLFIAGTRFDFGQIKRRTDLMFRTMVAASAIFVIVVLATKFVAKDFAPTALIAASVIASSMWFPGQFRLNGKNNEQVVNWQVMAVTFTSCAFLVVYFADVLSIGARVSLNALAIVVGYEAVKLFVLFGFAYFICSRFLARASAHVSATRMTIGYVLITVLIFGLTLITTNQLGAFAWAFIAGALWQGSEIGREFREAERPVASAMLMTLAFVPLMLQTHRRDLGGWLPLLVFLVLATAIKAISASLSIKSGTQSGLTKAQLSLALSVPGEIAIGFLGFAITRWPISGTPYFLVLGYALISTVLIPSLWASTTIASARTNVSREERHGRTKQKGVTGFRAQR